MHKHGKENVQNRCNSFLNNISVASLLFLDTPVGVGFSYSNATYEIYGDDLTGMLNTSKNLISLY